MQVREDRREHWIPSLVGGNIFLKESFRIRWIEMPGEALQGIDRHRVAWAGEVSHAAKDAESRGKWQTQLFQACRYLSRQNGSCRGAVQHDVVGPVCFQQFLVNGHSVIDSRGERMFGRQTVEHRDNFDLAVACNWNGLRVRAGI